MDFIEAFLGLKIWAVIAAWIGSAISLSYMPQLGHVKMLTTLASGGIVAMFAARGLRLWFPLWPEGIESVLAFFIGVVAMPVMPAGIEKLKQTIAALRLPGV